MAGSIVLSCLIWIAIVSLISMAVAVWVKWRIAATALMLDILSAARSGGSDPGPILRTQWGNLINFTRHDHDWSGCASFARARPNVPTRL